MTHVVGQKRCSHTDCAKTFMPHRWGKIKAVSEGWFLQKDGTSWCPDHIPEWVVEWRAGRGQL